MNIARNMTTGRPFMAVLFSFLLVAGSGSVAVGDLLVAPKGLGGLRNADEVRDFLKTKCFARDTLVSTETGLRPIGEIKVGIKVHSFDFDSGEWKLRTVTDRIDNTYEGPVVTVTTDESTIETTIHHPFWVVDGHELADRATPRKFADDEDQNQSLAGRWVNSHDLLVGDVIIGKDGRHHAITGISQRHEDAFPVSNLTIGEFHNYAVGPTSILVHNDSICADGEAWLRGLLDDGIINMQGAEDYVRGAENAAEVLARLKNPVKLVQGLPASTTLESALKGTGNIRALTSNPNLSRVDVYSLLKKSLEEIQSSLTKKQWDTLKKHLNRSGGDITHGN